jgi:ATP-dependent RNA helicase A
VFLKDVNCNSICGEQYSPQTAAAMNQLSEKSLSFELIEVNSETLKKLNSIKTFVLRH